MEKYRTAKFTYPFFFLVVLASRLPLLGGGFGSDGDAWRNAVAAIRMHELGHYVASRPPGFPVFESLLVPLVPLGWVMTNALTAVAGVVAAIIFLRVAKRLEIESAFWLTFAFAFSGVLWVYTTQTMDYAVGLGFLLGSYWGLLNRRYLLGALLLALAAGCRLTTGALVIPALAMLFVRRDTWRDIAVFLASFVVATTLIYIPAALAFRSQGPVNGFLWHASLAHVTLSSLPATIRLDAVFLFGKLGSMMLVLSLAGRILVGTFRRIVVSDRFFTAGGRGSAVRTPPRPALPDGALTPAIVFEASVVVVITALYLMVPYEVEYLIPLFPFVLLLAGRLLTRRLLIVFALLMVSEVMITPLFDQHKASPGRLFLEINERRADLFATRALENERPPEPTVFIVGKPGVLRLLVMAPSLERTLVVWPRILEPSVALWSPDRHCGYAAFLDQAVRDRLESEGYQIKDLRPPQSGL